MSSLNKVMLIGNLGRDPEVRHTQDGRKVVTLSVATSESWKDKQSGEKRERTEWHTVAIFSEGLVSVAEKYLRTGSKVYVEGQLETRKWQDQSGNDRYSTEVVLRAFRSELVMLGDRQDDGSKDRQDDHQGSAPAGSGSLPDDEIPFMMEWRI